jgi:DNA-binding PadR family transcriptional regulator
MIYRHLKQLEEDGLAVSRWETEEMDAAKRMYTITLEGKRRAGPVYIYYMNTQTDKLRRFINMYYVVKKK